MFLIQILLPVTHGDVSPAPLFHLLREELTTKFGGLTLHRNAPAQGLWDNDGDVQEDAIVIAEVMATELDRGWWLSYRKELELRFRQEEIVIRAASVTRL
jgi:hypothetical protein